MGSDPNNDPCSELCSGRGSSYSTWTALSMIGHFTFQICSGRGRCVLAGVGGAAELAQRPHALGCSLDFSATDLFSIRFREFGRFEQGAGPLEPVLHGL